MALEERKGKDFYLKSQFRVEIDGYAVAGFLTCSALKKSSGVSAHRNGDDGPAQTKQPGYIMKVEPITLTQGLTKDSTFFEEWFKSKDRKSLSVVKLGYQGDEVERHNCVECFPSALELGEMDSNSETDHVVRTITIEMEDFDLA